MGLTVLLVHQRQPTTASHAPTVFCRSQSERVLLPQSKSLGGSLDASPSVAHEDGIAALLHHAQA